MIAGVVLAAGGSERFGSPKQLAVLHGRPLLTYPIETLRAVPAIDLVVVVLGAHVKRICSSIDLEDVEVVVAPGWREGIAASLRAAVAAADDAKALVIVLGDQPLLTPQVVAAVLDRADGPAPAARATFDGAPGHPVVIKRDLFAELAQLRGDEGARDLLASRDLATIECRHLASALDVDTPADLQAAESRTLTG